MLVARRFVFFDFNLKAKALILAALGVALALGGNGSLSTKSSILSPRSFRITRGTAGCRGRPQSHATIYCLPPGIATCYPRSVNRNIFYIIGVIVVIVIVLKVLHVF